MTMIRRYAADQTQPTLEVIRKLAVALGVRQMRLSLRSTNVTRMMSCACSLRR
ncbi:hypothetical protein [Undibacterium sp. Xuan67W]|uniref:hypothetical protein n=1 Tax=Undibacterium sp. Xuan67W TaxID=3413057 RepID=UPI003BF2E61A